MRVPTIESAADTLGMTTDDFISWVIEATGQRVVSERECARIRNISVETVREERVNGNGPRS